jgi:branched-chain amino acid transport system permease protein
MTTTASPNRSAAFKRQTAIMRSILAACAIGLLVLPYLGGGYAVLLATSIFIQIIGVLGLNLITGNAGLISLGYSGFLAIGGYANAILQLDLGLSPLLSIPSSGAIAAVFGLAIGIPSLRLRGLYLAITTLAFAVILNSVIVDGGDLTRGSEGINVPDLKVGAINLSGAHAFYYVCLAVAVASILFMRNVERSRFGRALMALRDYETAATISGVNLVRYKLAAFVTSSFFIGVSGALFAHYIRYLNVDNFSPVIGIEALAMVIAGGLGSYIGSVLGVVFLSLLSEGLRGMISASGGLLAGFLSTGAVEVRGLIYGLVIILFLRLEPAGLIGAWRGLGRIVGVSAESAQS